MNQQIINILRNPTQFGGWTYHGLGMVRLPLGQLVDGFRDGRMQIWDKRLVSVGVSEAHTHMWDFKSTVVFGRLLNCKYTEMDRRYFARPMIEGERIFAFNKVDIVCGPQGTGEWGQDGECWLREEPKDCVGPCQTYTMKADEIHRTEFDDSTVTVIERSEQRLDRAVVYWPRGSVLGCADPRPAKEWEVLMACDGVCSAWGLNGGKNENSK